MIVECEICGAYTEMDKAPSNNICPVCCSIGALFNQRNPVEEQLAEVEKLKGGEG